MSKIEQRKQQKANALTEAATRLTDAVAKGHAAENWMQALASVHAISREKTRMDRIRSTPATHFRPDEPRMDMRRVRKDQRKQGGIMIRLYPDGGRREVRV